MKKFVPLLVLIIGAYVAWDRARLDNSFIGSPDLVDSDVGIVEIRDSGDQVLAAAFENHISDLQVEGAGVVSRILADDNDGSRHQRFILNLASGQQLLVAHNIDLAPRISALREGDYVAFYGVYEWNTKGGVIHWTHHDPQGRHVDGCLQHNGRMYR